MAVAEDTVLLQFFEYLFSYDEGYLCIATTRPPARRDTFNEKFFRWPKEKEDVIEYIDRVRPTHNVYFGVNILSAARRIKTNAIPQNLIWADLDSCSPDQIDIPPQCVIESSPKRYQAIWRLDRKLDPYVAENYGKRLAYLYAHKGVDKSGHDLTQLLRVPDTYNFKYQIGEPPVVRLLTKVDVTMPAEVFDALPQPIGMDTSVPDIDLPELHTLPSPEMIIERYKDNLLQLGVMNAFARYYGEEPSSDWSGHLWRFMLLCFEAHMSAEEVYVLCKTSKSNKYERDNRPESHLWREILKAESERKTVEVMLQEHRYLAMPPLLTKTEEDQLERTIINEYTDWGTAVTDAVPEFHEISCAMLLSALMSSTLRLYTNRPTPITPNLWAMILGESTLTRKTTAMDMAMDFVLEIDPNLMLTSDATVEGLISRLALRPRMVSIFYRDEVSGFFDSMLRKDYLAGMHETMTKLYDVPKYMVRSLKKDTYSISEPMFIFFGGGVPDKMYSLIDESYFASGFIPRFLIMRGHADLSLLRPTGPPVLVDQSKRDVLKQTFTAFYETYTNPQVTMTLHDGQTMEHKPEYQVVPDNDVWTRMAEMETALTHAANDSPESSKALPCFSRMYVSLQKLAMLLAAARQEPDITGIRMEMRDLLGAAYYIQKWGRHSVDLIRNSGVTAEESKLMSVYHMTEKHPGVLRSTVMVRFHLNAREMDLIENTLLQRMMISLEKKGRSRSYWAIGR